jgi:hypothetical protein
LALELTETVTVAAAPAANMPLVADRLTHEVMFVADQAKLLAPLFVSV